MVGAYLPAMQYLLMPTSYSSIYDFSSSSWLRMLPVFFENCVGESEVLSILSSSSPNAPNASEVEAQSGSVLVSLAFFLSKIF